MKNQIYLIPMIAITTRSSISVNKPTIRHSFWMLRLQIVDLMFFPMLFSFPKIQCPENNYKRFPVKNKKEKSLKYIK